MEFPLLAGLGETDRRQFLSLARRRKFARREVVFHEGDPGDTLHLVASGHVAIRITTPNGDVALVRIVCPGEFFGELALLSAGHRSATAVAVEPAETLSVTRSQFDSLRSSSNVAMDVLVAALAAEVRRLATAHAEALYVPAQRRIYRRLAEAARSFANSGTIRVPLTQDEVAQLAGTTRPTANQALQDAQEAGAIALRRGCVEVVRIEWLDQHGR